MPLKGWAIFDHDVITDKDITVAIESRLSSIRLCPQMGLMSTQARVLSRQHARGNARFYQEGPEDREQQRPFDRGAGQDQYYESTTRGKDE